MIRAYEEYEFHAVFHAAYNYFTVDLSAFYLDALKDRLYCSGRDSRLRRSAQTALFRILTDSLRLLAPLLPFTTEEAWESLASFPGKEESVHLAYFPDAQEPWLSEDERRKWDVLIALREKILKQLETARESKLIGNALEAKATVLAPADQIRLIEGSVDLLSVLCIVSSVRVERSAGTEIEIKIDPAEGQKCRRCWNYSISVGTSSSHPDLCRRCEDVLAER
jgi:isoleucyl-tRNA synthetase